MSKQFKSYGLPYKFAKGRMICLTPVFMDIETANNHAEDPKDLVTWMVSCQIIFNGKYYLFRYPEEVVEFYRGLISKYHLEPTKKGRKLIITYIHNLSYDASYLVPYLMGLPDFDDPELGVVEAPNKFLTFERGAFQWRCSYRLSGMSLEKWSKEMNIEHKKAVGLYDYDKIIYPDDELDQDSKDYDYLDVLSMQECLDKQMAYHGDDLSTIPLTATGYIRRTLRNSCQKQKYYREDYFLKTRLNAKLYKYCLRSYAGGYTHNNRFWANMVIRAGEDYEYIPFTDDWIHVDKIKHRDFKSHYPSQMACYRAPIGRPQHIYKDSMPFPYPIERIFKWMDEFYFIVAIKIDKAYLRDPNISMPFMQFSKMYQCHCDMKTLDNGRVVYFEGSCMMYLDSLTLKILYEQYHMEFDIREVWRFRLGRLPDCIIDVVDKYFKGKSDKKAIVHELTEKYGKLDPQTVNAEFELMQDKKGINSIYGCTATNPLRDQMSFDDDFTFFYKTLFVSEDSIEEGLEKYYKSHNSFLSYVIGCWVTASARYELYEYIKAVGYKRCLYCDTDSIFYISDDETEKRIEALNAEKRKAAHFVTLDNGKREYYDEFTEEPDCLAFKGLHSKCYGVVTNKGLEITIAGVPARTIIGMEDGKPVYLTREEELSQGEKDPFKALDHLEEDFTFKVNTGVCALYVGATGYGSARKPTILNINGHEIHTAGGCVIKKLPQKKVHDLEPKYSSNYEEQISIESLI